MKNILVLVLLLSVASLANAQIFDPEIKEIDPTRKEKIKFLNPQYLIYSPKEKANDKTPLLIYLHGSGGRGDNISKIRGQARSVWSGIQQFKKGPCLVVAPQCLNITEGDSRSIWIPEDLDLLLEHLKATYKFDHSRIYLTGNSMGGYGTWVWGANSPQHFAAIAPISGGIGRGGPKDVTPELEKWAANLAKIPVYATTGGKDKVVPSERSETLIAAIRKAGGKQAEIKVYPDQGHNARSVVLTTPEYYDWLFSKKRQ